MIQKKPPQLDWLATEALAAINSARPEMAEWLANKKFELDGRDRLGVLRWICAGLDSQNQAIVAKALGIEVDDLAATARSLQKI
jgi:hypothetical protein